jgi:hypothetical protein
MAALVNLSVYQINSMEPIPLASVSKQAFPFSGITVRPVNGSAGQLLSSGVTVYGNIQILANGSQYLVIETPAAIVALS